MIADGSPAGDLQQFLRENVRDKSQNHQIRRLPAKDVQNLRILHVVRLKHGQTCGFSHTVNRFPGPALGAEDRPQIFSVLLEPLEDLLAERALARKYHLHGVHRSALGASRV